MMGVSVEQERRVTNGVQGCVFHTCEHTLLARTMNALFCGVKEVKQKQSSEYGCADCAKTAPKSVIT